MSVMLTDDEVAAISVHRGEIWPGVLPTVPVRSRSALAAAVNRGVRSLAVRGLGDELGDGAVGVGAAVAEVLRSTRRVSAQVVHVARPDVAAGGGVVASIALGARAWTLDTYSPNGVHAFDQADDAGLLDRIMAIASSAFASGVADAAGTEALAFAIAGADAPTRFLVVTEGTVATVEVTADGLVTLAEVGVLDAAAVAEHAGLRP
ncbi:hypothetical protein [Demequina iriomotensis]|uniref:hypothetical protein n=1 Tax=Demequina iriomotensis TaxID=1536641 RepID=UPI000784CD3B|nr:hypothetical protein [Demequina iriomotensis]